MKNFKLVKNKKFGFLQVSPTPSKMKLQNFMQMNFMWEYKNFNDYRLSSNSR